MQILRFNKCLLYIEENAGNLYLPPAVTTFAKKTFKFMNHLVTKEVNIHKFLNSDNSLRSQIQTYVKSVTELAKNDQSKDTGENSNPINGVKLNFCGASQKFIENSPIPQD